LPGKAWPRHLLLGVSHLVNVAGIGMSTYGAGLTSTGEMNSVMFNRIGNILQLIVLFGIFCCAWPTYTRIRSVRHDAIRRPALLMLWAVLAATPLQSVRLAYLTTYAFTAIPSLDPVTGAFVVKLVLIFGTQLIISLIVITGGWLGIPLRSKSMYLQSTDVRSSGTELYTVLASNR
jgi:hypothetical protein